MIPNIIGDDPNYDEWCEEEIMKAYKLAAEYDEFMFGDYNYNNEWNNIFTNDVN